MDDDNDADIELIEHMLRTDAKRLVVHFRSAIPPVDSIPSQCPLPSRWIARLSTAVAGVILTAACVVLVLESHRTTKNPPAVAFANPPVAEHSQKQPLAGGSWISIDLRNEHGVLPVVFQLVDDQGVPVGTGLLYPEHETPIDFSQLSILEQEAAYRLLGLDLSDMPGVSI